MRATAARRIVVLTDAASRHPLRVIRWAGLSGSVCATIGSYGAGALPVRNPTEDWPILGLLVTGPGSRVALSMVYVGVGTLILAWLALGRSIQRNSTAGGPCRAGGDDDPGQITEAELKRLVVWWAAPLLLCVPMFTRDIWSYAAQAHIAASGLNPYRNGPIQVDGPYLDEISHSWIASPAPYGPLWLMVTRWICAVTGNHVTATMECARLLSVAGAPILARYLPRFAVACGGNPRLALWLGLVNPLVLLHGVAGGHNDLLMIALGVAGLTLLAEGRCATGVLLITCGAAIKAPIMLALAFAVPIWAAHIGRSWLHGLVRVCVLAAAGFTAITLASEMGFGWISQLGTPGSVVNWVSLPTGLAMAVSRVVFALGFGDLTDRFVTSFRLAADGVSMLLVVGLWLSVQPPIRRWRQPVPPPDLGRIARALGLSLLAVVLFGAVIQPWYLLWPFIVLASVSIHPRSRWLMAGAGTWFTLMCTPSGATLYTDPFAVLVVLATTLVVLGAILGGPLSPQRGRVGIATGPP